jgi:transcriptional regulator with XRE-family HTH domain
MKLSEKRKQMKISQKKLSDLSGVSVCSIRAYEQGTKDVNKAQGITLYKLSKALKCNVEDILEI